MEFLDVFLNDEGFNKCQVDPNWWRTQCTNEDVGLELLYDRGRTLLLGLLGTNVALGLKLLKEASSRGHQGALWDIECFKISNEKRESDAFDLIINKDPDELFGDMDWGRAIDIYVKAIKESSDVVALQNLGRCFHNGWGIEKNRRKSAACFYRGATMGYCAALRALGICFAEGWGLPVSKHVAFELYIQSANKKYARGQCNLATCYQKGWGVTVDYQSATKYYALAAEQGHATAYNKLGLCYSFGIGVEKDLAKAAKMYKLAAESGGAVFLYDLARCYDIGTGVPKDLNKAVKYYSQAAAQGLSDAIYCLGVCYDYGEGVSRDVQKAIECWKKGAEKGHPVSLYYLGFCYEHGKGVTKDQSKAIELFEKAVERGHHLGYAALGRCYANGTGVPKDLLKAVELYKVPSTRIGDEVAFEGMKQLLKKEFKLVPRHNDWHVDKLLDLCCQHVMTCSSDKEKFEVEAACGEMLPRDIWEKMKRLLTYCDSPSCSKRFFGEGPVHRTYALHSSYILARLAASENRKTEEETVEEKDLNIPTSIQFQFCSLACAEELAKLIASDERWVKPTAMSLDETIVYN